MATKIDPIGEAITRDLKELSQAHLDALAATAEAQLMLHSLLKREARRTEHKFGTDHPRTQQQHARLQSSRMQINALMVEQEREQIQVPKVAEDEALIHGQVVDNDGRGIAGLMAHLSDQNAAPIHGTGESTTDKSGYFAIILTPKLISLLKKRHETGVFLAVTDAKGGLIQRQSKPLVLDKGTILVKEIKLSRSELFRSGSVEPPPPEPDHVTVPDLVGQREESAVASLEQLGLELGKRKAEQVEEEDQRGQVLAQSPEAGSIVLAGSPVILSIGETNMTRVPRVLGLKIADAQKKITAKGLTLGEVTGRQSDDPVVVKQDPKAETEVRAGTEVRLIMGPARLDNDGVPEAP